MIDFTLLAVGLVGVLVSNYSFSSSLRIHEDLLSYTAFAVVGLVWDILKERLVARTVDRVVAGYRREKYELYSRLDQASRGGARVETFADIVVDAIGAIQSQHTWLLDLCGDVLVSAYGSAVALYRGGNWYAIVACVATNAVVYLAVTRPLKAKRLAVLTAWRQRRNAHRDRMDLTYARFQSHEYSAARIAADLEAEYERSRSVDRELELIDMAGRIANRAVLVAMILAEASGGAAGGAAANITLYTVAGHMHGIVGSLVGHQARYQSDAASLKAVDDFFQGKTFVGDAVQVPFPRVATIEGAVQSVGRVGPVKLEYDDRVMVQGDSGIGKSMLLRTLLGRMSTNTPDALVFRTKRRVIRPNQLQDDMLYLDQILVSATTMNVSSVDVIFSIDLVPAPEQAAARALAAECLELVQLGPWFRQTISGDFDARIAGRVSSGEAVRLCLAATLHKMFSRNCRVLILDEPDRGVPPKTAAELLEAILTYPRLRGKIIICVSHTCPCAFPGLKEKVGRRLKMWTIDEDGFHVESGAAGSHAVAKSQ